MKKKNKGNAKDVGSTITWVWMKWRKVMEGLCKVGLVYRDTEKLPDGPMFLWVATAAVNSSNLFIIHYQLLIVVMPYEFFYLSLLYLYMYEKH